MIQTRYDEVVVPFSNAFLGASPKVTNVVLQDKCPANLTEHGGIIYDNVAIQWMENALSRPGGPANPAFEPTC